MSWLLDILDSTDEYEVPKSFIFWSGLCAISAVVKNRVWWDRFAWKVYPNIYVLLVGKAGITKSFATASAASMVSIVGNTRVISGINSIEAIFSELSKTYIHDGTTMKDSAAFLVSDEWVNLILDNPYTFNYLNQLYDGKVYGIDQIVKTLKSSGKEKLKDISITMFGALTPTDFSEVISRRAIEGGFLSRTIVIEENRKYRINSFMTKPTKTLDIAKSAEYLKEVSKLSGEFTIDQDARDLFNTWYTSFCQKLEDKDKDDNIGIRIPDKVCKVSMLISLSRDLSKTVILNDVKQSIEICEAYATGTEKLTLGTGKNTLAMQQAKLMKVMLEQPDYKIKRQKLLQKFWGDLNHIELDSIMENLDQAGIISISNDGSGAVYELKEAFVKKYVAKVQGAKKN